MNGRTGGGFRCWVATAQNTSSRPDMTSMHRQYARTPRSSSNTTRRCTRTIINTRERERRKEKHQAGNSSGTERKKERNQVTSNTGRINYKLDNKGGRRIIRLYTSSYHVTYRAVPYLPIVPYSRGIELSNFCFHTLCTLCACCARCVEFNSSFFFFFKRRMLCPCLSSLAVLAAGRSCRACVTTVCACFCVVCKEVHGISIYQAGIRHRDRSIFAVDYSGSTMI